MPITPINGPGNGRARAYASVSTPEILDPSADPEYLSLLSEVQALHTELSQLGGWAGGDMSGAADSALATRLQLGQRIGLCSPHDKLNHQIGCIHITPRDSYTEYGIGGISSRLVNCFPDAVWNSNNEDAAADIIEDEDPNVITKFEESIWSLLERLAAWPIFRTAHVMACLDYYSLIIIGDGKDLSTELSKMNYDSERVLYLRAVSALQAPVVELDKDKSSPRYGLPIYYELNLGNVEAISPTTSRFTDIPGSAGLPNPDDSMGKTRLHYSRVIHITRSSLGDRVYGRLMLQPVWVYLTCLKRIVGGGSIAAWFRANPGVHINIPQGVTMTNNSKRDLMREVQEYMDGLRRIIRTSGTELNVLEASVHSFGPNAQTVIELLCGTLGIPYRIAVGSEAAQLASEQDEGNFDDRVNEERRSVGSVALRDFVDRLIEYQIVVPPAKGVRYQIKWPTTEELSEDGKANLATKLATANQAYSLATGGQLLFSGAEIRQAVYGWAPLEDTSTDVVTNPDTNANPNTNANVDVSVNRSKIKSLRRLKITLQRDRQSRYQHLREPNTQRNRQIVVSPSITDLREPSEITLIHRIAEVHLESVTSTIDNLWSGIVSAIDFSRLQTTLELGSLSAAQTEVFSAVDEIIHNGIMALVDSAESGNSSHKPSGLLISSILELQSKISTVIKDSGRATLKATKKRGSWSSAERRKRRDHIRSLQGVRIGMLPLQARALEDQRARTANLIAFDLSFDATHDRIIQWARAESSRLITEIDASTRDGIQELIAQGLAEGIEPRRLMQRIRESVGLRTDQVRAVNNLARDLELASPGDLIERFPAREGVRDIAGLRIRVPDEGMTRELIDKWTDKYTEMHRNYRSRTIARTETNRSANEGQKELWFQAQDTGLLSVDAQREWIATDDDRVRDEHWELDGQTVGLHEDFDPPIEPGEEVNCRCGSGIVD